MNRERTLDELIDAETTGAERQRLQHVHDLLLEAGAPPELSPKLEAGPTLAMTLTRRRRAVKPRAMLLLAAALASLGVFFAGYLVGNGGNGKSAQKSKPVIGLALKGTSFAPRAQGTLEVWRPEAGNWPMTLRVVGLPKLPPRSYYEVYLLRGGKPWGSCGTFRVEDSGPSNQVTVTLTAPYPLRKGDSWVVTLARAGGTEPGKTVMHPITA